MAVARPDFPLPDVADERTAPFFAGAAEEELRLPRCEGCGRYVWYPAPACPACGHGDLRWVAVSGRGTLFTWVVVRRPFLPAFAGMVPFVTGLVAIDEDPAVRVVTYVVDADPHELRAGMPMDVAFRPLSFPTVPDRTVTVPVFRPTR